MSPLYIYTCTECGREVEELRPMASRNVLADCPECGHGKAEPRMATPGAVRFAVPGVRGHYTREAR